jgi:hypothetical protein
LFSDVTRRVFLFIFLNFFNSAFGQFPALLRFRTKQAFGFELVLFFISLGVDVKVTEIALKDQPIECRASPDNPPDIGR